MCYGRQKFVQSFTLGCSVLPLQGADGWDLITQGVALGQIVLHFQCEKHGSIARRNDT